jgi:hypothetical protein
MRNTKLLPLLFAAGAVTALAVAATPIFASNSKNAGIYSSRAPEDTDPTKPAGPAFSVSLGPDGTATVTQDTGKGAMTTFGRWTDAGGQITVKFDAVGEKPADAPMVFQTSHDGLHVVTYNHTFWGKINPPEMKKEESNWHTNKKHGLL